jgi:hypothetical protein
MASKCATPLHPGMIRYSGYFRGQTPKPREDQEQLLQKLLKRNPNPLGEDQVKQILQQHLESHGWQVKVMYGCAQGIDIEATNATTHWIIEVKGWAGGGEQQQGNYFLCAIAELLQRMTHDDAKYSLAFPDLPRYRGLWERLPILAKRRTQMSCLFVDKQGRICELS